MMFRKQWKCFYFGIVTLLLSVSGSAAPDIDEIVQLVQQADAAVTSGCGTTEILVVDERINPDQPHIREIQQWYKWVFQSDLWQQDERLSVTPNRPAPEADPVICGRREGGYYRYIPDSNTSSKAALLQLFGEECKGKVGINPLWAQHVGLRHVVDAGSSLSEDLIKSGARLSGSEEVDGIATVVLNGEMYGQQMKWWLAKDYGYRLVKLETRHGGSTVTSDYSGFQKVADGVWLPTAKSTVQIYKSSDGSTTTPLRIDVTTVYESINKSLDQSRLSVPPVVEGMEVIYTETVEVVP